MYVKVRLAAVVATLFAALGATSVAAAPALAGEAVHATPILNNWVVEGSLTAKKLNQKVTLPEGSTFNGRGDIELEFIPSTGKTRIEGTLTGNVAVPPFSTMLTLPVGGIPTPVSVGMTFTQVGPAPGKVLGAPGQCLETEAFPAGCISLSVPTKVNVGFTLVGILGIEVPTHCETSQPVNFNLKEVQTLVEVLVTGPHFVGTATIPSIKCDGLEGLTLAPVMTTALSGPGNPYELKIHHPPLPPLE